MILKCILLIVGFVVICLAADWLVDGASALAKRMNVSDLVIGLTIVGFGTSAPELVVNITAALNGASDIALTNILGSNIINTMLILGVSALIYPIVCKKSTYMYEIPMYIFSTLLILFLGSNCFGLIKIGNDDGVSRIDGLIFLVCFAGFMYYSLYQAMKSRKKEKSIAVTTGNIESEGDNSVEKTSMEETATLTQTDNSSVVKENTQDKADTKEVNTKSDNPADPMSVLKALIFIVVGLVGLVVGGRLIVDNAVFIAEYLGVRQSVIGITIVALGTSLPELATSVVAAIKKNTDLAIGNVIGSNLFNIFFVVGISATISPLHFYDGFLLDAGMNVLSGILLLIFMFTKRDISRYEGLSLLIIFGIYMYYLLINA